MASANEQLLVSAEAGNLDTIKRALSNGADIEVTYQLEETALIIASKNSRENVVLHLISLGANIEARDWDGWTALMCATRSGDVQIVNILLTNGANVNTKANLGETALMWAAERGHDQIVNILLINGANVNNQTKGGWTALMCAADGGHHQIVNILQSNGANVNIQAKNGCTALMWAAGSGHDQIVNTLLNNGANVNTQDNDGWTALISAAVRGHDQIVNMLLSNGANVNTQANHGQTAIMKAAERGFKEAVEILITNGADVSLKDDDGLTALHLANKQKYSYQHSVYPAIIKILSTPPAATPDITRVPSDDMNPSWLAAIKEPVPAAIKEPIPENAQPVLPPSISSQPAGVLEVEEGKDIILTVIAEGSIPLTYQWNRDGEQLQDGIQCDGTSTKCLLVKQANVGVKGQYCCTVSNIKGVVTSNPTSLTIVLLEQQRNLKRLENMMTDKSTIHLKCLKLFLVGPPFVGKTTTLKRLQKDIKNILSSGDDAKAKSSLLSNFSHSFAYVDQDPVDYEWLSPSSSEEQIQHLFQYLCAAEQSDLFHGSADNKEKNANESALDKSPISTPTEEQSHIRKSGSPLSKDKRRPMSPARKTPFPKVDDIMKEFRAMIKAKDYSSFRKLLEKSILLSINDVGGQPGFLEMLPALIRGPALYLMFLSLCEALDKPYSVPFNRDGVTITPFDAIHTVESTISQLLSAVSSIQPGSDSMSLLLEKASGFKEHFESFLSTRPVTAIIGTHKDRLEGDADAVAKQIQDKQQAMEKIASKHSDIIVNASSDSTFFALDNYKGEEEELTPIRKFILDIFKTHFSKATIPIRPAWLLLSLFLCEHYHIISIAECYEIGRRLDMNEEEVKFALQYLHHCIGTVIYLPNVPHDEDNWFRNHIICTPQVVFDSISQIMLTSLRILHSSNATTLHCDHSDFVKTGLFSMDSIEKYCKSEEISKMLSADELIPAQKLVMFLQYVNLLAPISPGSVRKECKETMYFLPALLDGATEEEITKPPQPDANNPAPILITFDFGYVPTGVFCGMITRIVSHGSDGKLGMKWELKSEGVKRNMVIFVVDGVNEVTLLAHSTCYEIRIKLGAHNCSYSLHDLCCLILSTVLITLKELFENLEPRVSFHCSCEKHQPTPTLDYRAVCTLEEGVSSKFVCQSSTVDNKLKQEQVVWISKYAYLGSSERLEVLKFTPADRLKTFSFDWSKEGTDAGYQLHENVLDIKAVTDNHFSYYKCEIKKAGKLMFTAYRKLIKTDLKFSIDFNCEELVAWLKQKGIPAEDLKVFKEQKIDGRSFLDLPLNKKEFNEELECSWTFGGWRTFVKLIGECGEPANIRHQPSSQSDIKTKALQNNFKLTDELTDHPIEERHSFYVSDQFRTWDRYASDPSIQLNEGEQHTISANPNLINNQMKMKDKDVSPPSSKRMKMSHGSVACKVLSPSISSQPTSVLEVRRGKDFSLRVIAEGSSPLTYQWTKDRVKLEDGIHYDGSSSSCLLIKQASIKHMGQYCCTVSNTGGQSTSIPTNLIIADLMFSINFNCEELVAWLKQKGIPREDLKVFKEQNIKGKSFLRLPRDKDEFSKKLKCSWTFGGWETFVELMEECGVPANIQPASRSDPTTKALQKEFKITDELIDSLIEERDLFYLGGLFGAWKSYAGVPGLGLSDGEQHTIHADRDLIDNRQRMVASLKIWQHHNPLTATFCNVLNIVLELNDVRVAKNICQYIISKPSSVC